MTDLDLIREFRADAPGPDAARLATGRSNLMKTINPKRHAPPPHPRPASPSWWLPALAVTAAAAVAVGLLVVPGNHAAPRPAAKPSSAKSSAVAPVTQAELAARILRTAADVVTRAPVKSEPAPGQWIYAKTVQYGLPGYESPAGVTTGEEWTTFDGGRTAYYRGGQLIVHNTSGGAHPARDSGVAAFNADATPQTAYDALASLPADPKALLAAVDKAVAQDGGIANVAAGSPIPAMAPTATGHVAAGSPSSAVAPEDTGQGEFDYLVLLLWNAAAGVGAPARAQAAAFRAMATIPGVTVQQGITDAAGAPAIGVSADGGYDQILLDPVSYQVIGLRQLSTGVGPATFAPGVPPKVMDQIMAEIRTLDSAPQATRDAYIRHLVAQHKLVMHAPPKGTLELSLAYATVREVSAPGTR